MSVWMGFRCCMSHLPCAGEVLSPSNDIDRCYSHDNIGPMGMASATQKGVIETYRYLSKVSEEGGWKKIDGEWVCPHCLKNIHKNHQNN